MADAAVVEDIKELSISGGGVRGIAFLGALYKLKQKGKLNNLEKVYSCSIGSLLATCLVEDHDLESIIHQMLHYDFAKLTDYNTQHDIIKNKAYLRGEEIEKFFKFILKEKTYNSTLKELYERTNIELYITVYCLNTDSIEYVHYNNYPDLNILQAILMSCAIPLLLPSVQYKNKYYIDGAVLDNSPVLSTKVTLLKAVKGDTGEEDDEDSDDDDKATGSEEPYSHTMYEYVNKLRKLATKKYYHKIKPQNVIKIPVGKIKATTFKITKDEKFKLLLNGMRAA